VTRRTVSIVVPAHDEETLLPRLLRRLLDSAEPGELEIVVVANGCTDDTVGVAKAFGDPVRVLDSDIPSKRVALRLGDADAGFYPRLYVDADVELGTEDVRRLCAALDRPGVLAAGPTRVLDLGGRRWPVRWYYRVWTRLPEVRAGLFGRGVIAMTRPGHERVAALPPVMADDLAISLAFAPAERVVVDDASVLIRPPRTWSDLVRRRVRAETSTTEIEQGEVHPGRTARTSRADLLALVRTDPRLAGPLAVFLATAVVARLRARRAIRSGDFSTWLRDSSSRT
jgi:glycosyltransferase involved in cell wall biosynthesis